MRKDELREKVARSLAATFNRLADPEGDLWEEWLDETDAALAAIESTGHVIVPREPTEEMVEAGQETRDDDYDGKWAVNIYRAMLTACGRTTD